MARRQRRWLDLAPSTRKRYLGAAAAQGLSEAAAIAHYEAGGSVTRWRGQRKRPVGERRWRQLRAAAQAAGLGQDTSDVDSVLESLFSKGFSYDWIMQRLIEKRESRDKYRSATARAQRKRGDYFGWEPGRRRFEQRVPYADIELYYYH